MNKGLLSSIVLNALLIGTIFYVKGHYMGAARDYVEQSVSKKNELIKRLNNAKAASELLWELGASSVQPGMDKKESIKLFKSFVKKHADKLEFSESRDSKDKAAWVVSWSGIDEQFKLVFNYSNDRLKSVDFSGMTSAN